MSGVVGTENIRSKNSALNENNSRTEKYSKYSINEPWIGLFTSLEKRNWTHKNFFKAMDRNSVGFMHLKNTFPGISDAEIKDGVFSGLQIES